MVIFVDANVLVLYLLAPETDDYRQMTLQAADLFERAFQGELELFTSDSVLAEVAFTLTGKRQFGYSGDEVARLLMSLVRFRGLRIANKQIVLNALELWAQRPSLGFVDSLGLAYGMQPDFQLATFDKELLRTSGVNLWMFKSDTG